MDDTSIIIAAALFAFIGMALSVWVVWAVALAVLAVESAMAVYGD